MNRVCKHCGKGTTQEQGLIGLAGGEYEHVFCNPFANYVLVEEISFPGAEAYEADGWVLELEPMASALTLALADDGRLLECGPLCHNADSLHDLCHDCYQEYLTPDYDPRLVAAA